jgi:CheY-like chemotaxis protein
VVKQLLTNTPLQILEAASGQDGLALADRERPAAILLDLEMPDITGFDVLDQLKRHPNTQAIPVIIYSSTHLNAETQRRLVAQSIAILSKEAPSQDTTISQLQAALINAGLILDS